MQRLSTFPEGWPGFGLLFLRGSSCFTRSTRDCRTADSAAAATRHLAIGRSGRRSVIAGWFLDTGRRCVDGGSGDVSRVLACPRSMDTYHARTVAAALAMLGPGAWSVDARLFGRKRIQIRYRWMHERRGAPSTTIKLQAELPSRVSRGRAARFRAPDFRMKMEERAPGESVPVVGISQ